MHYVDTSVLAALYLPETLSAAVQRLLGSLKTVAISNLTEVELCSALSRRVRMAELGRESASLVVTQFRAHQDDGLFRILPVEARHFAIARDWLGTFRTPLRTLDALHLAVAFAEGAVLVTADRGLAGAARAVSVKCRRIA